MWGAREDRRYRNKYITEEEGRGGERKREGGGMREGGSGREKEREGE